MDEDRWSLMARKLDAKVSKVEAMQSLWSGYGEIVRLYLKGSATLSVVCKSVRPPRQVDHPRGWAGARSHRRKWRSYEVELCWYRDFAARCSADARLAACFFSAVHGEGFDLLLEDLHASGFDRSPRFGNVQDAGVCLAWLAEFHAEFLGTAPVGLWPQGSYWHLETRPDELAAMTDKRLQEAAPLLDAKLRSARYQTLIHGDAKIANFLLGAEHDGAAAVDFQYVGGGPGIRDVAYLLGSCLDERDCETHAAALLDHYFVRLGKALCKRGVAESTVNELEQEWRELYPVAWTDFYRFLQGWCPGHKKIHAYTREQARLALD